ncbi:MAG: restriction endonuclease, partial [Smithellaceae bacterium]
MLKIIEDQPVIKKYVRQFTKGFKPFIDEEIKVKLGHQGASFPAKVLWSKNLGIWKFSHAIKGVRYWNAFGVGKPQEASLLSITAEINFPWTG